MLDVGRPTVVHESEALGISAPRFAIGSMDRVIGSDIEPSERAKLLIGPSIDGSKRARLVIGSWIDGAERPRFVIASWID